MLWLQRRWAQLMSAVLVVRLRTKKFYVTELKYVFDFQLYVPVCVGQLTNEY